MAKGGAADFADLGAQPLGAADFSDLQSAPMQDAPNSPAAEGQDNPDDTMKYLAKMAKAIYGASGGAFVDASKFAIDAGSNAGSVYRGLKRQPEEPGASVSAKLANTVGRAAPAVAGTAIAGALTGGAGLIPAAAAAGLGAAAGEAYGQLGARALGGNAPETAQESAVNIGMAGAEGLASELAIAGGLKIGKKALEGVSQALVNVSPRALTRVFERYSESPIIKKFLTAGPEGKAEVERQGVLALNRIQNGVERVRGMKGRAVENALNGLSKTTKGQPVAIVDDAIAATEDFLRTPGIDVNKGTAREVSKLLEDLKSAASSSNSIMGVSGQGGQAKLTVKDLIAFRRRADKLGDYARKAMNEADRDVGIAAANTLGNSLRGSVDDVAKQFNNTQLLKANKDFSEFIGTYRNLDDFFGSKSKDTRDMLSTLNRASRDFGGGGMAQEALLKAKKDIPFAAKDIDHMLDAISVKAFTQDPKYTPSSTTRAFLRQLASPQRTAKVIAAFQKLQAAKPAAVIGSVATQQALGQQYGPRR